MEEEKFNYEANGDASRLYYEGEIVSSCDDLQEILDKLEEENEEDFLAHHSRYLNINFTNGHLNAHSLNSPMEYIEEGEKMHHCVGGYYTHANSLIFAVEEIATSRKVATVEVNIENLRIEQIAGVCNLGNGTGHGLLPEWNEIYDMVTANMHIVKERKSKKIRKQKMLKKVA